ncbi:MAG: ABC transporter ATP-binding protein [Ruminococcaceae bacterium]|nr:ABC transporter ATP-binding protein [Oscillospiraceae bacterium]
MRKILSYIRLYKKEAALGPLFKMLEALFELFIPLVVADIIDVGIKNGDTRYILTRCGVMVLLGVIGLTASITAQYFSAKAAVGLATDLRRDLFAHIGRLSYASTDTFGTATLLSRATTDINQVQHATNIVLRLFLRSPFIVFGAMIMAFTVSPSAALTFVVTIPLLAIVVFGVMLISIPMFRRVHAHLDRVLGHTRENLSGARVVRAFVREEQSIADFTKTNAQLTRIQRFTGRFSALLNPVTYVIINLSILVIIWRGGIQVEAGSLTQGGVVALYNYMSQILIELIKMANFIILITKAVASGTRINAIFNTEAGLKKSADHACGDKTLAVEFKNVSLSYHEGADTVLENISFSCRPGETVGIIGGTGAGKSSLVALIPRFYDATSGAVLVGGRDVRDFEDVHKLRERIGIVPQKAELFAGTVRDNLRFGNAAATDDECREALATAQALAFVEEKEGGLDFLLEQGARNLSGGQKQRLTIARALVRRPEILILDDSASALDYATDAALRAAIKALPYHPTTFIVSQRTASISHADRIIVLDDGRAVGIGTHETLLESCPIYREIHESQFGREEVAQHG